MKIRTGFVSNSSGSSFILVYLPEDFDFYVHKEYLLNKHKSDKYNYTKDVLNKIKESDFNYLIKNGSIYETDNSERFYFLHRFLNDFILLDIEVQEESGWIKIADKKFLDKTISIDNKFKEKISIYKNIAEEKRKKVDLLKDRIKKIDPFEEENWEDEIMESSKIKKFKDLNDKKF